MLSVDDEEGLFELREILYNNGIQYVEIMESGGQYDGQAMAIGVVPDERASFGSVFKKFKLLGAENQPLDNSDESGV